MDSERRLVNESKSLFWFASLFNLDNNSMQIFCVTKIFRQFKIPFYYGYGFRFMIQGLWFSPQISWLELMFYVCPIRSYLRPTSSIVVGIFWWKIIGSYGYKNHRYQDEDSGVLMVLCEHFLKLTTYWSILLGVLTLRILVTWQNVDF